ncbi:MAG TPA: hypothetical protein VK421_16935 [Pyrinomonadaceae bacterium]|nr:hypothetical protein [Pyrinomonadaceae bacterium]
MDILNNLPNQSSLIQGVALVLTFVGLLYAVIKGAVDLRDLFYDLKDRIFTNKEYRVKTTIIKTLVRADQTEIIKLRTVRVFRKRDNITLDPLLQVEDKDGVVPNIVDHYSAPGRTIMDRAKKEFIIRFSEDEILSPRADHSVVLGYRVRESAEYLYGAPGMVAKQPVGEERLVVEYHFPLGWHIKLDKRKKPILDIYAREGTDGPRHEIPAKKVLTDGGPGIFWGNSQETHWFRVTIKKPPQDEGDINIDWEWDKKGEAQHVRGS